MVAPAVVAAVVVIHAVAVAYWKFEDMELGFASSLLESDPNAKRQ